MAFLVEDGSGTESANAYITVAEFTSHFTDRGTDVSDFDTDVIQAGIVKATDYIEKRFSKRFKGFRQVRSQGLSWPRLDAIDDDGYTIDGVPANLKKATAEYSLLAIKLTDLLPVPAYENPTMNVDTGEVSGGTGTAVIRDRSRVGVVEEEKWYSDPYQRKTTSNRSAQSTLVDNSAIPAYPVADLWIAELLDSPYKTRLGRA